MIGPTKTRVTFDTNVCNVIHDPDKWPTLVAPDDARKIRAGISGGRIAASSRPYSFYTQQDCWRADV